MLNYLYDFLLFMASYWMAMFIIIMVLGCIAAFLLYRFYYPYGRIGEKMTAAVVVLGIVMVISILMGACIPAPVSWFTHLPAAEKQLMTQFIKTHHERINIVRYADIRQKLQTDVVSRPTMAEQLSALK